MRLGRLLRNRTGAGITILALSAQVAVGAAHASEPPPSEADTSDVTAVHLQHPLTEYKPEVRWWLAMGAHTDETIKESVQHIAESGFGGIEFAMLDAPGVDAKTFSYGSEEWLHDVKLIISESTKYGLGASFTSGTHWGTANIPGIDPNSQGAGQELGSSRRVVTQGSTLTTLPVNQEFVSAVAYKIVGGTVSNPSSRNPQQLDAVSAIDLTDDARDGTVNFTATDGDYLVFTFWQRGTGQASTPAVKPSYAINYFERSGFDALRDYWESYYFADDELVEAIRENGRVQLFMDSLEITATDELFWSASMRKTFTEVKGYDITPYLPVFLGTPALWQVETPTTGSMDFAGEDGHKLRDKVLADLRDVQTQMYMQNLMVPLKKWLNEEYDMKLRAQISYGKNLELTMPSTVVDFPETETRNQRDQTDIYRIWAGGAHLENKVLSSETAAHDGMNYGYSLQEYLQQNYTQYAGGVSRVIWHGYAADWGPKESVQWPGYEAGMGDICCRWGDRNPSAKDYNEYNDHLGRIQSVLRAGVPQVDLAVLYSSYAYSLPYSSATPRENLDDLKQQRHEGWQWKDLTLQDAGYTYDYFAPQFLDEGYAQYDSAAGLLASDGPGYRALLLNQDWIPFSSAERVLEMAKEGLKVVIVDGAFTRTRWNDGKDADLAALRDELVSLDNVVAVATEAEAAEALRSLEVAPRIAYGTPDPELLGAVRKDDQATYLYLYNYYNVIRGWDEGFRNFDKASSWDPELLKNSVEVEGMVKPFLLDTWTGETSEVSTYSYKDGRTIVPVEIPDGDVRVYIFKPIEQERLHVLESPGTSATLAEGKVTVRGTESGEFDVSLSDGTTQHVALSMPEQRSLTGWDLELEVWRPGELSEPRTERSITGENVEEYKMLTKKTPVAMRLDELTTWDNLDVATEPVQIDGNISAPVSSSPDKSTPARINVPLRNRSSVEQVVSIKFSDKDFWKAEDQQVTLAPGATQNVELELSPDGGSGWSTVRVSVEDSTGLLGEKAFDLVSGGIFVSDLDYTAVANGWGPVERDLSNNEQGADGNTISIAGREYSKGLGTHSSSEVAVDVPEGCTVFVSDYGIDDEVNAPAGGLSVAFNLFDGDTEIWKRNITTDASSAGRVEQDVTGVSRLRLIVTDGGDGPAGDHGDWAGAHFRCDPAAAAAAAAIAPSSLDAVGAEDTQVEAGKVGDLNGRDVSGIGTYVTTFDWDTAAASGAYLDLGALVESATVFVNGVKAEEVNLIDPVVDIPNGLMVDGQNSLKIVVTSTLTNALLGQGLRNEGDFRLDHQFRRFASGLPQAVLSPYQDVLLDVTDPDPVSLAFDLGGRGDAIAPQSVAYGAAPVAPAAPSEHGWVFQGWFADAALTTPFDFDAVLVGDATAYAKWADVASVAASLTVTPSVMTVDKGGSVDLAIEAFGADGTPLGDVTDLVIVTSSRATDVVDGATATLPAYAGEHVLTAALGAATGTATITVRLGAPVAVEAPSFVGTPIPGVTLVANPGVWDVDGVRLTYRWTADDVDVAFAKDGTLNVNPSISGKELVLTVNARVSGLPAGTAATEPVTVLSNPRGIRP